MFYRTTREAIPLLVAGTGAGQQNLNAVGSINTLV